MFEIEIADQQTLLPLDEDRLRSVVRRTLELEEVRSATISLAIVDNPAIHALNRQFLNHDYATDVISFSYADEDPPPFAAGRPRGQGRHLNGEVVVSSEMALELATDYDWPAQDELTLYIVHGLLHLCGYDDLTETEQPLMRAREEAVFRHLGLRPPVRAADDRGHLDEDRDHPTGATA